MSAGQGSFWKYLIGAKTRAYWNGSSGKRLEGGTTGNGAQRTKPLRELTHALDSLASLFTATQTRNGVVCHDLLVGHGVRTFVGFDKCDSFFTRV